MVAETVLQHHQVPASAIADNSGVRRTRWPTKHRGGRTAVTKNRPQNSGSRFFFLSIDFNRQASAVSLLPKVRLRTKRALQGTKAWRESCRPSEGERDQDLPIDIVIAAEVFA
jgi:hypothetical protein